MPSNFVTEKEARNLVCQETLSRTVSFDGGGLSPCFGSTCMAWRWRDTTPRPADINAVGYCGKVAMQ